LNTNEATEIDRGDIAAALVGQTIWSAEVTGDSLSDSSDEAFLVMETSEGVRLYADDPTAYRYELAGARVPSDEPVMIVLRDPDFANDYLPFTEGFAPVRDIDVDFGNMDLRDEGEFADWAEGHLDQAKQLIAAGGRNRVAAGERLRQIVIETAENHGHTLDLDGAAI